MPPKAIFNGHTFAISGRLSQPQREYEDLINKHGGDVAASVTKAVSFLVSSDLDVKARPEKVVIARGRGVPIVSEDFLASCVAADKLLPPGSFLVRSRKRTAPGSAAASASVEAPAEPRKRPRIAVSSTSSVLVIPRLGLEGAPAVLHEECSKGFMKASLTWDVELVLSDPTKGRDRFYCMQLLVDSTRSKFWAAQHYGRTGLEGRVHVDGPFGDVETAKRIFRAKYRRKSGNIWGHLGSTFVEVPGKYAVVTRSDASAVRGRWQYYMHNSVDGKVVGWHSYEEPAASNMEKYFHQFQDNAALRLRFVTTDYFIYEIDFVNMIQTNMKSGTRRVLRRVLPGETPTEAPPSSIPEAVAPGCGPHDTAASSGDEDDAGSGHGDDDDSSVTDLEREAPASPALVEECSCPSAPISGDAARAEPVAATTMPPRGGYATASAETLPAEIPAIPARDERNSSTETLHMETLPWGT